MISKKRGKDVVGKRRPLPIGLPHKSSWCAGKGEIRSRAVDGRTRRKKRRPFARSVRQLRQGHQAQALRHQMKPLQSLQLNRQLSKEKIRVREQRVKKKGGRVRRLNSKSAVVDKKRGKVNSAVRPDAEYSRLELDLRRFGLSKGDKRREGGECIAGVLACENKTGVVLGKWRTDPLWG